MVRVLVIQAWELGFQSSELMQKKKKKAKVRAREMSQPLRVVVVLAEDLDSVCSTHNRM